MKIISQLTHIMFMNYCQMIFRILSQEPSIFFGMKGKFPKSLDTKRLRIVFFNNLAPLIRGSTGPGGSPGCYDDGFIPGDEPQIERRDNWLFEGEKEWDVFFFLHRCHGFP